MMSSNSVPLGVTVTGLYLAWFGVHYFRDTKTHWASDPVKAVLTGKPIPTRARGAAPDTTVSVSEPSGGTSGGSAPTGSGTAAAMVAIARSQIGTPETPPGSNVTKYGSWFGMQAQWCDIFVSWCANQNGSLAAVGGKQSYVPSHWQWFQSKGLAHVGSAGMQAGDIVFQSPLGSHIAIATGNGTETISGNWGNKVSISNFPVYGYARPKYSSVPGGEQTPPVKLKPDPSGGFVVQ